MCRNLIHMCDKKLFACMNSHTLYLVTVLGPGGICYHDDYGKLYTLLTHISTVLSYSYVLNTLPFDII